MRLALYQPDIPQNTGTLMRLAACLGLPLDIIEPCGFLLTDKNLKRAGMDYTAHLDLTRHASWDAFKKTSAGRRVVLMTTKASISYLDFEFKPNDILMAGSESQGVPPDVHAACEGRVKIPMIPAMRSLNVAIASSMIMAEALRQTKGFPAHDTTEDAAGRNII